MKPKFKPTSFFQAFGNQEQPTETPNVTTETITIQEPVPVPEPVAIPVQVPEQKPVIFIQEERPQMQMQMQGRALHYEHVVLYDQLTKLITLLQILIALFVFIILLLLRK